MDRRKFIKHTLATGVGTSGALHVGAAKSFGSDAPTRNWTSITLGAKPAPIVLDLAKTVVIVVDMQNDKFGWCCPHA